MICHARRKKSPSTSLPYIVRWERQNGPRMMGSAGVGEQKEDPMGRCSCTQRWQTGRGKGGMVWDLWPHTREETHRAPASAPCILSIPILPKLHISSTPSTLVLTTASSLCLFHILNGFVALSTFRISHAHPIFNWFSQGAQDARYSTCFFRLGKCKWGL